MLRCSLSALVGCAMLTLAATAVRAENFAPIVRASHCSLCESCNDCSTCGSASCDSKCCGNSCLAAACKPMCDRTPLCGCLDCDPCNPCGCGFGRGGRGCRGCMDGTCSGGCFNTCNMPPHYPYFPPNHGHYYFRPYTYRTIAKHQHFVTQYGGDPRNPYDNSLFENVYESLDRNGAGELMDGPPGDVAPLPPSPEPTDAEASLRNTAIRPVAIESTGGQLNGSRLSSYLQIPAQTGTLAR